jgi:FkbH-like protein
LQDCRLFEPQSLTVEDAERTSQYRSEAQRKTAQASVTDMDSYLESLGMEAIISEFVPVDVPRLAQLINKSNQFNLTTRRRTEADILALMRDPACFGFSVRLKDRFGDHGLISIVIAQVSDGTVKIDTWLMSCRVLKRQVEDEVLNELARLAMARKGARIEGVYLPTAKNEMVRDFYLRMGFILTSEDDKSRVFELSMETFRPTPTKIKITRRAYEST